MHLIHGRAKEAEKYPEEFCDQLIDAALGEKAARSERGEKGPATTLMMSLIMDMCCPLDGTEVLTPMGEDRADSGLKPELVDKARKEEMEVFTEMKVYHYATWA